MKRSFGIRLPSGAQSVVEGPTTPSNIRIAGTDTKFGDFDPALAHIEQRDWSGGLGLENFVDDPARYFDGDAWTMTPSKLVSGLQWQLSSGYRPWSADLPGSVSWKALIGDQAYLARQFNPSTTYASSNSYFWLRKMGNPGNPVLALYSSAATAVPGASTRSQTLASSVVSDTLSVFQQSSYASVSLSSANTYWAVVAGNSSDTVRDHWEVACGSSAGGGRSSSNGTAWTNINFYPYHLVTGPSLSAKWHFFALSSVAGSSLVLHAVSQNDDGVTASSTIRLTGTADFSTVAWSSALTGVVKDVTVVNNVAYMARGGGAAMFEARVNNSSNEGQTNAASTAIADFVHSFYDPVDGEQLWRAVSSAAQAFRAAPGAFGTTSQWKPSTGVQVGDLSHPIVGMRDYDNQLYVRKADTLWAVKNDRAAKINVGLDSIPSTGAFVPMLAKDLFLNIGWSYSLERLSNGVLDDIGIWRGAGLPSSRQGAVSCLEGGIGWLFQGIDAGSTGVSGVYGLNDAGWHQIFRAPVPGWRVQNLKWWAPAGTRPRLLISCGGMIFTVAFPYRSLNPLKDTGGAFGGVSLAYQHESHIVTGAYDMGAVALPKLFESFELNSRNLNSSGTEVRLDYQLDDEVGGSTWAEAGAFVRSPHDNISLRLGDRRAVRFRLRMNTASNAVPAEISGSVLKGVARTPVKRKWEILAAAGTYQVTLSGLQDADPDDFYLWLQDVAITTTPIHMRSVWKAMDDVWVFVEPPIIKRTYTVPTDGSWGAELALTVREI